MSQEEQKAEEQKAGEQTAVPIEEVAEQRDSVLPPEDFEHVIRGLMVVPDPNSQFNVRLALRRCGVGAKYDEFADRVYLARNGKEMLLTDTVQRRLWLQLDEKFRLKPSRGFFREVLLNEAFLNRYHPVRQYLDSLVWDGEPRIDSWLTDYAGVEKSEYTSAAGRLFLIAAVRRVRQPGCKFDEIPVLEGEQGIGKSSMFQRLVPIEAWFSDNVMLTMSTKEVVEQTLGKWIVEIPELSGMSGADIEHIKAVLSRSEDSARMAYGRHRVDRPRQFVQVATTNDSVYLRDSTGNRRFWPVAATKIDLDGVEAERDQLWAEAAVREARGESIRLPEALWPVAAAQQEQRLHTDPWEDVLVPRLELIDKVARKEVWPWLGYNVAPERRTSSRLTQVMRRLGWKKQTVLDGSGRQADGFVRIRP